MEAKDKTINLFKYIKELYTINNKMEKDVKKYDWYKFLEDIPTNDENIFLNEIDEDGNSKNNDMEDVLLKVSNPSFTECDKIPETLKHWIIGDYNDYKQDISVKEKIEGLNNFDKKDLLNTEILFEDDLKRVSDFNEWSNSRKDWVESQKKIEKIRKLFRDLRYQKEELDKNSENMELVIGQGILNCKLNSSEESENVFYPILLKKVSFKFDAKNNIIYIIDLNNSQTELHTLLLQEIENIDHRAVKDIIQELENNFYHPLEKNNTIGLLKGVAHKLNIEGKYSENIDLSRQNIKNEGLTIYNSPVFFIRKKTGGLIKTLDQIISEIEDTGNITGPLLNLVGENIEQCISSNDDMDLSDRLAELSGEDENILLSKEANREQLEIAKRIENYNAVLVQGPPGTGKTHTIANLMGHFLAQGKNILVTSHTKKALSVVKEKVVPELQNLCVSVLDDNNEDMVKSVDGITDFISTHTSLDIKEQNEKLEISRNETLKELADIRKRLYSIKFKEYETIDISGKEYSVAEAAKFVNENRDEYSYIPGKVTLNVDLPITDGDLKLLYSTNENITIEEETELLYQLPNPDDLISPGEFENYIKDKNEYIEIINNLNVFNDQSKKLDIDLVNLKIKYENINFCEDLDIVKLNELKDILNKNVKGFTDWQKEAIIAGKKGGGVKSIWIKLIENINDANKYFEEIAPSIIGKNININTSDYEKTLSILEDMKLHLEKGKKLSGLSLLFKKDWKEILPLINIDNKEIETLNDCNLVILYLKLSEKRKNISVFWDELIGNSGGIASEEFGENIEQGTISFVPEIENCINWYDKSFIEIKEKIIETGFKKEAFNKLTESIQVISPIDEVDLLTDLIYKNFPIYIQISEIIYNKLPNLENIKINTETNLNDKEVLKSNLCKNLYNSFKDEDFISYTDNFKELNKLYKKYYYQVERNRILREIENYAPDWAKLVKNRVGIHGKNTVPENIEEAWLWKQFSGIITKITNEPFDELQKRSIMLSNKLRKDTAKLAENLSWYNLLLRIEDDLSKKQALQGWKMTVKKIGKGTGKNAAKYKREAQKLMAECQTAVPAWIMPINQALETLDPSKNKFDIVIIDEASQSDISALAIMYLAKKIIIVGDDEQVSPSGIGTKLEKMENLNEMYIKDIIPNAHLYDMTTSLYDIAKTTFPILMLKEHFRCVPDIIGYCNRLSYNYQIKPLRDDSKVDIKPSIISYRVDGKRKKVSNSAINEKEALSIVALMKSCIEHDAYKDKTFGAITLLGTKQAELINKLAIEKIDPVEYENRRILCGNSANFQGDERDIVFITLVDSNEEEGPLNLKGTGKNNSSKQRYNVAVSRAKDQLWVIHSLDHNNDLKPNDMRKGLIEYAESPKAFKEKREEIKVLADSPFEIAVVSALVDRGYNITQQWKVGAYRIDMVAIYKDKKVAIECDGELYHSGENKIREDMERQIILERLGWKFIRIRGSEYYLNPEKAIDRVIRELNEYGIKEEKNIDLYESDNTELQKNIIKRAEIILKEWENEENSKNLNIDLDETLQRQHEMVNNIV